ncbi:MAG: PAS domain S-box protein [Candidatus Delongbacteria bacterium]|nr:PAS domain S-box protein [Candidatus Delongbacteria bacterium]
MLKKLSFRTRLFLGFASLLILTLGTISFSFNNAFKMSKLITHLQDNPRTVGLTIKNIESNSIKINNFVNKLLNIKDEDRSLEILAEISQLEKQIFYDFDLVEDRYSGNEEDVEDAIKTYSDWKMIREEALGYLKEGDYSQAELIVNSLCNDYIELLSSKYHIIKINSFKTATEYFKKIELRMHKNMSRMLFFSIFVIILTIIISIIVANSISKPIKKLLNRTIEHHHIELDKNSSKFDEQELLETTIEELNTYYKKIDNHSVKNKEDKETIESQLAQIKDQAEELKILNSELENKVLLRTEEVAKSFEDLEENRDILKSYLNSSPDAIIVFDKNAKLTFASKGAYQMFQIDENINIKTINIFDFIDPSEKEKVGNNINRLIKVGKMSNPEVKLVRKDQTTFYAQTSSTLIKNKDNKLLFFMIAHDITERKEIEDELKKNEAHIRTLLDTIPDLVWLKDKNGAYLSCNKKFERFFGAKESDIVGKTDYDFVDKELADFFREKDKNVIIAGKPIINIEKVTYANDGHKETLETIKTPVYDSEKKLIGVLGTARDITERNKMEEKIIATNELLISVLDSSPIGIGLDVDRQMKEVNKKFCEIVGYSQVELIGKNSKFLYPSEEVFNKVGEEKYKQIQKKGTGLVETQLKKKDGSIIDVFLRFSPIDVNNLNKGVTFTVTDVTERKRSRMALALSEKKYRNMFENSMNAILIIENGKFVDCNQATIDLLGYKNKGEFLNTHPSELSPEKQPDGQLSLTKADEMIELALKNKNHRFKWDHKKADGIIFPVEVTLTTLENEKDHKVLFTIWRDLSKT